MKILTALAVAIFATFVALVFAINNLETLTTGACEEAFTAGRIVCVLAGLGLTFLAVPLFGAGAGVATWLYLIRRAKRTANSDA